MRNILVDTRYWLALYNPRDKYHERTKRWLVNNLNAPIRLATTWNVMCEAFYLIKSLSSYDNAISLFESYARNDFDIHNTERDDTGRMLELMKKYSDIDIDLADISIILLAEMLNTGDILTVDTRDFSVFRWNRKKQFNMILT